MGWRYNRMTNFDDKSDIDASLEYIFEFESDIISVLAFDEILKLQFECLFSKDCIFLLLL